MPGCCYLGSNSGNDKCTLYHSWQGDSEAYKTGSRLVFDVYVLSPEPELSSFRIIKY